MADGTEIKVSGILDNVKIARDYALEGSYENSIVFFDGAILQINK